MDELELLQKKIAEMQQKANELQQQRKDAAIAQAKELVKSFHLTAKDLGIHPDTLVKGEPKYRHGVHFWTGKGRKPQWVVEHLGKGGSLDDLKITKA